MKKKMKFNFLVLPLIFLGVCLMSMSSCKKDNEDIVGFGIFQVVNDSTLLMNGTIGSKTLAHFNNVIEKHPNIKMINMQEVPGSMDDEINLKVSKRVYDLDISTHLLDNGEIASGGVDFFLAGIRRTKGTNTKIGIHSWSDGSNEAKDYPVGHANHQPYINFYQSVGFTQEQAEAFYYFTINAAPASGIHWMTEAEIVQYNVVN